MPCYGAMRSEFHAPAVPVVVNLVADILSRSSI